MSALLLGLVLCAAAAIFPVTRAAGTGYDLSYSAAPGSISDSGVNLVKVASTGGSSTVTVSIQTEGPMEFCCGNIFQIYLGGSKSGSTYIPDSYVGDVLSSSNNTTWVEYDYYPSGGSPQLLWLFGAMGAGNTTFSVPIPMTAVPSSSSFSVEANAAFSPADPTQTEYTWLGTFLSCWGIGDSGNCAAALGTSLPSGAAGSSGLSLLAIAVIAAALVVVVLVVVAVVVVVLPRRRGATGSRPPNASTPKPPPGAQ